MNLFQTTALNDIIDTQVIPEFTISPEETKVCALFSSYLSSSNFSFSSLLYLNWLCVLVFVLVSLSQARLKLLPHKTGELHVLGVVYNLDTAEVDDSEGVSQTLIL